MLPPAVENIGMHKLGAGAEIPNKGHNVPRSRDECFTNTARREVDLHFI